MISESQIGDNEVINDIVNYQIEKWVGVEVHTDKQVISVLVANRSQKCMENGVV